MVQLLEYDVQAGFSNVWKKEQESFRQRRINPRFGKPAFEQTYRWATITVAPRVRQVFFSADPPDIAISNVPDEPHSAINSPALASPYVL
jgi:hypothetical protein